MMQTLEESLTYSDILIKPNFSMVRSRSDVSLDHTFLGMNLGLPLISANMDSVTGPKLAAALAARGGVAALHRFQTIEENIAQLKESVALIGTKYHSNSKYNNPPICSFGIGSNEYERALALVEAGAETLLLDVAHGAAIHVVEQYDRVRAKVGNNVKIIVGNFDNYESVAAFLYHSQSKLPPDSFKLGIGAGAACTTRVVTGCGGSLISALLSFKGKLDIPLIADGGIKTSGDIAKALACGASSVMVGSMLAGTEEAPGKTEHHYSDGSITSEIFSPSVFGTPISYKTYRGSASSESYEVQGKNSSHRTPEGESMLIPYKGPVGPILDSIAAGLKSSLAYTGSFNLEEFKENAEIVKVSQNTFNENHAHGKR